MSHLSAASTVAAWLPHPHLPFGGVRLVLITALAALAVARTRLERRALTTGRSSRSTSSIPSAASSATHGSASRRPAASSRRPSTSASTSPPPTARPSTPLPPAGSSGSRSDPRRSPSGQANGSVFAYWHIVPAVRNGQYASPRRRSSVTSRKGWGHVHLAELVGRPLREPAAARRADAVRRLDAPDDPHVQLRARRQEHRSHQAGGTLRPRGRDLGRDASARSGKVGEQAGHAGGRALACPSARRSRRRRGRRQSTSRRRSRRRSCSTASTRGGHGRTMRGVRAVPGADRA